MAKRGPYKKRLVVDVIFDLITRTVLSWLKHGVEAFHADGSRLIDADDKPVFKSLDAARINICIKWHKVLCYEGTKTREASEVEQALAEIRLVRNEDDEQEKSA